MWNFLSNIFKKPRWTFPSFTIDDEGFSEVKLSGVRKTILWSELENVDILTTADGPLMEDFYYVVRSKSDYMCISQLCAAKFDLLKKFDKLPGFKWTVALEAMTCTHENHFACWEKSCAPDPAN